MRGGRVTDIDEATAYIAEVLDSAKITLRMRKGEMAYLPYKQIKMFMETIEPCNAVDAAFDAPGKNPIWDLDSTTIDQSLI